MPNCGIKNHKQFITDSVVVKKDEIMPTSPLPNLCHFKLRIKI